MDTHIAATLVCFSLLSCFSCEHGFEVLKMTVSPAPLRRPKTLANMAQDRHLITRVAEKLEKLPPHLIFH